MGDERIQATVGRPPALNSVHDQDIVQTLLNRIPKSHGGAEGSLHVQPQAGRISAALQGAIDTFQRVNLAAHNRDGRVDPLGETLRRMRELAGSGGPVQIPWSAVPAPVTPGITDFVIHGVPLYGQRQMNFPTAAAENACWWAAIKMVKDAGGPSHDVAPEELRRATKALDILAIEAIYPRYHMYPPFPYPNPPAFTAAALISALQQKGPMCACGRFAAADQSTNEYQREGQNQHAIVVYGTANGGQTVVCNDPWQPSVRQFLLSDFNARLHAGRSRLIAATQNIRNWQSVSPSSQQ